jgi:8-oxo-dGTP pyrophosphatase MutT (NUDIX family)
MSSDWNNFSTWLQQRLQQPLPGYSAQTRMMSAYRPEASDAPADARQSGVLLLLYPDQNETKTVLIQRTLDGGAHSGQIALPGGKQEPSDSSIVHTALREAEEEVHLNTTLVTPIGQLSSLYIPVSKFVVNPVVAIASTKPQLTPSDQEVADILRPSLPLLFHNVQEVSITLHNNLKLKAPAYMLEDNRYVWGATAMILSELECIFKEYMLR